MTSVNTYVGSASSRGHVFFTESRYDVTVSSVTSAYHVIDLHVYTAPSVDWRHGRHGGVVCHLANVYHNDVEMGVNEAPFALHPHNNNNDNNRSEDDDNFDYHYYNSSRVSLYVQPRRDVIVHGSRDPGLLKCRFLRRLFFCSRFCIFLFLHAIKNY